MGGPQYSAPDNRQQYAGTDGQQHYIGSDSRLHPNIQAQSQTQEWPPHSAISSFNLPLVYDSSMITPVSLNGESPIQHDTKNLSGVTSHQDHLGIHYQRDYSDLYYEADPKGPMKWKESSHCGVSRPDTSMSLSSFGYDPSQPMCPPTPYFGSFSVSGTQSLSTPSASVSPASLMSPQFDHHTTDNGYHTPMLIQPSPMGLRSSPHQYSNNNNITATNSIAHPHQHQQMHQTQQLQQAPTSHPLRGTKPLLPQIQEPSQLQSSPQGPQCQTERRFIKIEATPNHLTPSPSTKPISRRRRASSEESVFFRGSGLLKPGDRLLLKLRREQPQQSWRKTVAEFNRLMESRIKCPLKESALQMRYKRAMESLRKWTPEETQALYLAREKYKDATWERVACAMKNEYGVFPKWTNVACKKRWAELHSDLDFADPTGSSGDGEEGEGDDRGLEGGDRDWEKDER